MSTIKADNIATLAGVSTSMANAVNGSAKAWVNFNGTGTVSIRAGFNVSSITDNGVGNYTVNFTNAMPDTNYATVATGADSLSGTFGVVKVATTGGYDGALLNYTTSRVQLGQTAADHTFLSVVIFR